MNDMTARFSRMSLDFLGHIIANELAHFVAFNAAQGAKNRGICDEDQFSRMVKFDVTNSSSSREIYPREWANPSFVASQISSTKKDESLEFFAKLGAFVLNDRGLARKLIPNGRNAFEDAVNRAKANLGLSETRSEAGSEVGSLERTVRSEGQGGSGSGSQRSESRPGSRVRPWITKNLSYSSR